MASHRKHTAAVVVTCIVLFVVFTIRGVTATNNDFHFVILGDRTGGVEPQIFGRVWYEVDLMHPDFVLTVGDTIEGTKDETVEAQWAELRPLWERYKHYPIYFTPGNHDIWSPKSRELYVRETRRQPFYSFDYQQMHFTVLDNSRGTNELSDEQMQFLEEDLRKNQGKSPKLVVFHKPFWIRYVKEGGDFPLHQLAKKYGVEHIVSGHGHQFVRMVREGVTYMEVGSSGGGFRKNTIAGKGFRDGYFYHFIWAKVEGGKVQFTVKEIGAPMGQGRIFKADDWDENGPKFEIADPVIGQKPQT